MTGPLKLSAFFGAADMVRECEFRTLGGGRCTVPKTLAYADTLHHLKLLTANPNISGIITRPDLAEAVTRDTVGIAVAAAPRDTFYDLHEKFIDESLYPAIPEPYRGENCRIHPSAMISGSARIDDGVTVGENAVVLGHTHLGEGVLVEPGVILGVEGILYRRTCNGIRRIRHAGAVDIGANATLLAKSAFARSVHPSPDTRVGMRSIIGIATTIGHEALVGNDCVISGNCVVARNAVLGDACYLGTAAVVTENVKVGARTRVMAGGIVVSNLADNVEVSGNFATPHIDRLKQFARNRP